MSNFIFMNVMNVVCKYEWDQIETFAAFYHLNIMKKCFKIVSSCNNIYIGSPKRDQIGNDRTTVYQLNTNDNFPNGQFEVDTIVLMSRCSSKAK
jgi:hypothetical protein